MIGPHVQRGVPDWLNCLPHLPPGTWVKVVNDQAICREIKSVNPALNVVFRYEDTDDQRPSTDYETNKDIARTFFSKFIDGTFWQQQFYLYMDAVEEWNEYLANSQSTSERAMWDNWCAAVNDVWFNEYRQDARLNHIKLVSCNTAIGNDIPASFAETVKAYNGLLGYHGYIKVTNGVIDPGDWQYHSGRFATMDAGYRARGIVIDWLGTEGSAYHGVLEGWRHDLVYGGNRDNYINGALAYRVDRLREWNAAHNNRWLGDVLFSTGDITPWEYYEHDGGDLLAIALWQKDYIGGDDMTWQSDIWGESVNEQIERGIPLNPDAGLQQLILNHGDYTPVHRERQVTASNGRRYGFMAGESVSGNGPRKVWVYEVPWSGPGAVTVIDDPN